MLCVMDKASNLKEQVAEAHRGLTDAMAKLFQLIRECDEADAYSFDFPDAAAWLKWNLALAPATARKWVRIARQLEEYPDIERAFERGDVSFDQVELLMRHATPETAAELLELALRLDVSELRAHLKALADEQKARDVNAREEPQPEPLMRTWWIDDVLHFDGSIPGADGVAVETSLRRLATKAPKDTISDSFRDYETRLGEALVQMASESLAEDRDHDRATIVIHIPAAEIMSQAGAGWDAARRFFDADELQRLLCDARIQPAIHDAGGVTVGVGRKRRTIDPWLRRLVEARDGNCRFPGCDRSRWLHAHHQREWHRDKGPTNLDNLILLCGFHHRLIHNEKWEIVGDPNKSLTFLDKHGYPHRPARNPNKWIDFHLDLVSEYTKRKLTEVAARPPP